MMRSTRVARLPPRERILDAAEDLFFHEGIRKVTVEAIASKAETTKMAVYRHFGSKDALVSEWLRVVAAQYAEILDRLASTYPQDPRAQLLGWAEFIAKGLADVSYRGCPFVNSLAELPDREDAARQQIETHKALQAKRLKSLCRAAGIQEPGMAAAEITFLLEGAQITAQNRSIPRVEAYLMKAIRRIVDGASGTAMANSDFS